MPPPASKTKPDAKSTAAALAAAEASRLADLAAAATIAAAAAAAAATAATAAAAAASAARRLFSSSSLRVSLADVLTWACVAHTRSAARLVLYALHGPLREGKLCGGRARERPLLPHELDAMCDELDEEDAVAVLARSSACSRGAVHSPRGRRSGSLPPSPAHNDSLDAGWRLTTAQDASRGWSSHATQTWQQDPATSLRALTLTASASHSRLMRELARDSGGGLPALPREAAARLFDGIPRGDDGLVAFVEVQRVILEARERERLVHAQPFLGLRGGFRAPPTQSAVREAPAAVGGVLASSRNELLATRYSHAVIDVGAGAHAGAVSAQHVSGLRLMRGADLAPADGIRSVALGRGARW